MILKNRTILAGADNDRVIDNFGQWYYDLTSGWNVMNAGWNNPIIFNDWITRIQPLSYNPPWCTESNQLELTLQLNSLLPGYFPIYSCSGSEAIDNALKFARLVTGKSGVACIDGAYHGGTLGAALATGYSVSHLESLDIENKRYILPVPDSEEAIEVIRNILSCEESICAVVFETILTNFGCRVISDKFIDILYQLSQEQGFLIICDEIGTGINRTGYFCSFEKYRIKPHVVTFGKALTNGLYPLSVALISTELRSYYDEFLFTSTYGGTASACAAALSTISFHRDAQLQIRANELGKAITQHFDECCKKYGVMLNLHGSGLSMAIDISKLISNKTKQLSSLVHILRQRSIFAVMSSNGEQLMITPVLTTDPNKLMEALSIVIQTIIEIYGAHL